MEPDPAKQSPPPLDEGAPDLECAICFSQFNNVFRTPKMLQCNHTFCLECLARMNVKSAQPDTIQCPLCRSVTPLPVLGLPKLDNNPAILSYLPEAMQRVYSVRFNRNKGRLQVKRAPDAQALPSLCTVSNSLDVGLPPNRRSSASSGRRRGMLQLSNKPSCRVLIMISIVLLLVLLTCIIIFLQRPRE